LPWKTIVSDLQELHTIVKQTRSNAAPGPDGLNAAFYKTTWDWIGDDVHRLVSTFYQTTRMPGLPMTLSLL
jgi:hypothetical protein